jgi:hypothetical protein
MKKKIIFGFLFLVAVFAAVVLIIGRGEIPKHPFKYTDFDNSDPNKPISKSGLITDIDYYLDLTRRVNPDPYRIISPEALGKKAGEIKARIKALPGQTIPLLRCFFIFQELVAFLQDEHHYVMSSRSWIKDIKTPFPLRIFIFNNRVFVKQDLSKSGIPEFAELLTINQREVKNLTAAVLPFINETLPHFKTQVLERQFGRWIIVYFKLMPPWEITYRFEDSEYTKTLPAKKADELLKFTPPDDLYREYQLKVDDSSVPVLEIPRFWFKDRPAYNKFMDDFFKKYRHSKYLVIDLRRNPGGDGRWGAYVLNYLTSKPYLSVKRFDFKISREFKEIAWYNQKMRYYKKKIPRLLWWFPPLKSWVDSYWLKKTLSVEEGEWAIEHNSYVTPDPGGGKFKGKTFLLISHRTNSAAVVFASNFKYNKLGTVVGRETGGRLKFTSDPYAIEMPNSTLRVVFTSAILELPGDNPDRGVIPDVVVPLSLEDYKSGTDRDIEKVKELIRADKN